MSEPLSPEAYGDAIVIIADAPSSILPMSVIEMHLYAYLGCIFALFTGRPIGEWGYKFAVTSDGFPFSAQLEDGRRAAGSMGLLETDDKGLMSANPAAMATELELLMSLTTWTERRPCLRTAMECALALPVGSIRYAINQTPGVAPSLKLGQRRQLLDEDDIALLYEEYQIVDSVLGVGANDLLSPAVIWLSARILRTEEGTGGIQR